MYNENNLESNKTKEEKLLKICCLTWNMHGLEPTHKQIEELLDPHKDFDIYCIGSEECMRSISQSFFFPDKSLWEKKLEKYFGEEYKILKSETLIAIHLVIFIKAKLIKYLSNCKTNHVKTGGKNLFGNKGAVGISFSIFNIKIMIINCHLAAKQSKSTQRNLDYKRCISQMSDSYQEIDFIVFMGDLNYRLNNTQVDCSKIFDNYLNLLVFDQLQNEKNLNRLDLLGFNEAKIQFMPTFKYWNNTNNFQYLDTNNIDQFPGWTDRILYKKNQTSKNILDITQETYDSMQRILMSDHKPVYSYFTLKFI